MRRDVAFVLSLVGLTWFASGECYPERRFGKTASSASAQTQLATAPIEMQRLAWLVGAWETGQQYEPGFPPSARVPEGTATVKIEPGGLSLVSDYQVRTPEGLITGHQVIGYDPAVHGYWIFGSDGSRSRSSATRWNAQGDWESEVLRFEGTLELNGKKLAIKLLFYDIGPNSFSMILYSGENASKLRPTLTAKLQRRQSNQ